MGLDITAFRGLRVVRERPKDDETGYEEGLVTFYPNPDFMGREGEIQKNSWYSSEDSFHFRAGSYGGYNQWREQLAKMAGYPPTEHEGYSGKETLCSAACWNGATGPFSELINFSDCEGVIGADVSKKLAKDFAQFQTRAAALDPYFMEMYAMWKKAFEMAADGGAVNFS